MPGARTWQEAQASTQLNWASRLAPGLVFWMPLTDSSGRKAREFARGKHGDYANSPSRLIVPRKGRRLHFPMSTDDRVGCGVSPVVGLLDRKFTVAFRARATSLGGNWFCRGNYDTDGYEIRGDGSGRFVLATFFNPGESLLGAAGGIITTGVDLNLVAAIGDSATSVTTQLYRNLEETASGTPTNPVLDAARLLCVNGSSVGGGSGVAGAMWDVRVYSRQWIPADVSIFNHPAYEFDLYWVKRRSAPKSSGGATTIEETGEGTITFGGTAGAVIEIVRAGAGVVTLSGAATDAIEISRQGAGGIAFDGTTQGVREIARQGAGELVLGGAAAPVIDVVRSGAGGVVFAGAAAPTIELTVQGAGGVAFAGGATRVLEVVRQGAGSIDFAGAVAPVLDLARAGVGGITFTGTAPTSATLSVQGAGTITFSGAASYEAVGPQGPLWPQPVRFTYRQVAFLSGDTRPQLVHRPPRFDVRR